MTELTLEQQKALEYKHHIALTANAGSGKTLVFAKRFIKIAIEENPELDKIIAITFTEKAASELYSRIVKEVETLMTESPENFTKLNLIRKRLVSAKISTIHSFCLNLLRDYSPQAGLDAKIIPVEEHERDKLLEKAFDDAFEDEIFSEPLRSLLRYFGSKNLLRKSIIDAINKRRFLNKLYDEIYSKEKNDILNFLKKNADYFFEKIALKEFITLENELAKILSEIESAGGKIPKQTLLARRIFNESQNEKDIFKRIRLVREALLQLLKKQKEISFYSAIEKKLENPERHLIVLSNSYELFSKFEFENLYENFDSLATLSLNFFKFYKNVLDKFSHSKYENGFLDFEDILLYANELLKNDDVLADLQTKYKYIMVDEYQDTNEIQYEIIMPILDKLRRGNLFVVGDEKQSIYMFNNAELEIFNLTKEEVNENSGENLELPHSFRLKPNNALFVNSVFPEIFANADKLYNEVEFNPLIVSSTVGEGGRIEILISREEVSEGEKVNPPEAEILASKIADLLSKNEIKLEETAVLTRQNKYINEVEKALSDKKIPYVVLGGVGYFQELAIRDIQNYLMFLSSVNNDVALLSVLRSPFYAFSDAELFKISLKDGWSFWEKLNAYAKESEKTSICLSMLKKHINYAKSYEIPILLNKILTETNYWFVLSAKKNSHQEIANVKKLLNVALGTLKGDSVSLYEFANKLNELVKEKKNEGSAQTGENEKAVKIMTFHKSKGLEFGTVFLYKTGDSAINNRKIPVTARQITFDKNFGMLAKTPSPKGYFETYKTNSLNWLYEYYQKRKELAEAKRLFYVAVTRAKENLFISATVKKSGKVGKNSMFQFLLESLNLSTIDEEILLSENLFFDTKENPQSVSYKINIEENKIYNSSFQSGNEKKEFSFEINPEKISDTEVNEFISATKIALYKFCPIKYKLTYELGYGRLSSLLKGADVDDLNFGKVTEEEKNIVPANYLGLLLHKALELEIDKSNFSEILDKSIDSIGVKENFKHELITKAENILRRFLDSEIYIWLKNQTEFKNEYEIYSKKDDFFLYGIIDKLVFNDEKLIVVDYKSDKISDKNYIRKYEQYEYQLKFYLYILSLLYPETEKFEAKLVFLTSPGNSISREYSKKEISDFGEEISKIVKEIRNKSFYKNEKNCNNCIFFEKGKCVYENE